MKSIRLFGGVASMFATLAFLVGCSDGPRKYDVSGTLTIDGAVPPAGSSITFIPSDGKNTTEGCTLVAGKYSTKVATGMYKVEIRAPKVIGKAKPVGKNDYQTQGEIVEEMLPAKYNDKTELTFEVKAAKIEKNWELKTK